MKVKIGKGHHYPWLIPIAFPVWVSAHHGKRRSAWFKFTKSCLFDLQDEDQHDVNKLFGFSIGNHHKTSFRFGWRPILKNGTIEIVAYEYHDGVRQTTMPICEVETDWWFEMVISYRPQDSKSYYFVNKYNYWDNKEVGFLANSVNVKKKWGLGYTLGIYFGGNEVAPQDITIYRKI
ncbi:MAG: hypothetical protein R3182_06940 [Draconibacterium sp.]|nr:hypothetical protein [Draconibacterium sp.]